MASTRGKKTLVQRIALDGGDEIRKELEGLGEAGRKAFEGLKKSADQMKAATTGINPQLVTVRRRIDELNTSVSNLTNRFKGLGGQVARVGGLIAGAFSVRALIDMTSAWTDLNSQIRNSIREGEEVSAVMERLTSVANRTYTSIEATVGQFSQNAATMRDLGLSTSQQLDFQESLNNALVVSNARGDRARQVQEAIAKAMATGKLSGEGLNTVLFRGGRIAQSLAKTLGVTQSELRKVGESGRITSQVITKSLIGDLETLREEADRMPATIEDGFLRIRNSLLSFIGQADEAAGVSSLIAEALIAVSNNIGVVVTGFGALAAAFLLVKSVALAKDLLGIAAALVRLLAALIPVVATLAANPFGLAAIGIGLLIAAIIQLNGGFENFGETAVAVWEEFMKVLQPVMDAAAWLVDKFTEFFDLFKNAPDLPSGGGNNRRAPGFAGGGGVRGPGSGTSDSIWARLSNGEFVVRAAAVRKYGSQFLHAINSMRAPAFASGGMASLSGSPSVPIVANSGDVDPSYGGRPINLTIGDETFSMAAPESVAEQLSKFATGRQARRSGKMPSWYR